MEKAILKTLIYADLFGYPLKINEIHKWLIKKKATPRQIEKALKSLNKKVKSKKGFYFLRGKENLISKRQRRKLQSEKYFKKAKIISLVLKIIPWIKLVGISGGLAMSNASKKDDIDLFIITSKNSLWISRLLILGLLSLTRQRRKRSDQSKKAEGKCCVNILLEEDKLEQKNKDLFISHEVLQMKPLWYKGGVYSKYLESNSWAFKFLPNWVSLEKMSKDKRSSQVSNVFPFDIYDTFSTFDNLFLYLENLAKWLQLKIMQQPTGLERIEDGALYFHPEDCRQEVLLSYKQKVKRIISP